MIYNLSEYVKLNSVITPITNGFDPESKSESVMLQLTGGEDRSRGLKVDDTVQFISKSKDKVTTYELIQIVYNLLKNRFGIDLPEVTVNSIVYPAVKVWQFIPLQNPGYIGTDDNGLHQWSVNFQVTIRR